MLTLNIDGIDESKSAGVEFEYQKGIFFTIARNNNPEYKKTLKALYKKNKRFIDKQTLTDEQADELLCEAISQHILVGWKGLMNGKEEFKYTQQAAKELLLNETYLELREWIVEQSQDMDNYRVDDQKK
jgi:hypothetical protein